MAAVVEESKELQFRYTPLNYTEAEEDAQKFLISEAMHKKRVENWSEEGRQVPVEYDLLVTGSYAGQDIHSHTIGPGFALAVCTVAGFTLLRKPKYITSNTVDKCLTVGIKYYSKTQSGSRLTEVQEFLKQHATIKEQVALLDSEFISTQKVENRKAPLIEIGQETFESVWDDTMEEDFIGGNELDRIMHKIRDYTVGKMEDLDKNLEESVDGMEAKRRRRAKQNETVFPVVCILCAKHASFAIFVNEGGQNMTVFDPFRRDGEEAFEIPQASFTHFVSFGRLKQFLIRRIHEIEAKWLHSAILKLDTKSEVNEYYKNVSEFDENEEDIDDEHIEQLKFKERVLAEKMLGEARSQSGHLAKHVVKTFRRTDVLTSTKKKYHSLFKSLIFALHSLRPFRVHFAKGARANQFGSPFNCLVSAVESYFRKIDVYLENIDAAESELAVLPTGGHLKKISDKRDLAIQYFQNFLCSGECCDDLDSINNNLRHMNIDELEPAAVLDFFLKTCHSTATRSPSIYHQASKCGTGGVSQEEEMSVLSGLSQDKNLSQKLSGARRCIAHSVFNLHFTEERKCQICHRGESLGQKVDKEIETSHYLTFLYHMNVSYLRASESTLYMSRERSGYKERKQSKGVTFTDCLQHITQTKWRSHCPYVPECEVCGLAASVVCYSCNPKDIFRAHEECIKGGNHVRLKALEPQAPSVRNAHAANRVVTCLCMLCEKKLHSISNRLGMRCLKEFADEDPGANTQVCHNCGEGQRFDSVFYASNGPINSLVRTEQGETKIMPKEMFLCQRCDELRLYPPMTTKSMFSEIKETKRFVTTITSTLKKELDDFQCQIRQEFRARKEDISLHVEKIESELHRYESGAIASSVYGSTMEVDRINQIKHKREELKVMQERLAGFDEIARKVLSDKIKMKKYETKRRRDVLLAGKRGAMAWRSPHVIAPLPRSQETSTSATPCRVDSQIATTLRAPPSVFNIAIDWGHTKDDSSTLGFSSDTPWLMDLLSQELDIGKVFSSVSQNHDSDDLLWLNLMEQIVGATAPDELLMALINIRANVLTATVDKTMMAELAGCAYIKSGGRVGAPHLKIENMQKGLLARARQLRRQSPPDEFQACHLETRWEMRYRLDQLGYCWDQKVRDMYSSISEELHQCASEQVFRQHSTRYIVRSIMCRRVEEEQKVRLGDEEDDASLRHTNIMIGKPIECSFETYIFDFEEKQQWFRFQSEGSLKEFFGLDILKTELKRRNCYPVLACFERLPHVPESSIVSRMDLGAPMECSRLEKVEQILEIRRNEKMSIAVSSENFGLKASMSENNKKDLLNSEKEEEGGCAVS
jgi:hypothetical protein